MFPLSPRLLLANPDPHRWGSVSLAQLPLRVSFEPPAVPLQFCYDPTFTLDCSGSRFAEPAGTCRESRTGAHYAANHGRIRFGQGPLRATGTRTQPAPRCAVSENRLHGAATPSD